MQYLERNEIGKLLMVSKDTRGSLKVALEGASIPTFNGIEYGESGAPLGCLNWACKIGINISPFEIAPPKQFLMEKWMQNEDDILVQSGGKVCTTSATIGMNIFYLLSIDIPAYVARAYIRGNNVDVSKIVLGDSWLEEYLLVDSIDHAAPYLRMIYEEGSKKGLNVNRHFHSIGSDWNCLSFAAYTGAVKSLEVLLDAGGSPNQLQSKDKSSDPLFIACMEGKVECAELLINRGAIVNLSNSAGTTPLCYACFQEEEELVRLLIGKGKAETNIIDEDGRSLLCYCISQGMDQISMTLLKAGADPLTFAEADGVTCLHWCAHHGLTEVAHEILRLPRCDVDARTVHGETPLLVACGKDQPQMAEMLLYAGADFSVAALAGESEGCTPLSLMLTYDNDQLALECITKPASANGVIFNFLLHKNSRTLESLLHIVANRKHASGVYGKQEATGRSSVEVLEALLAHGAEEYINDVDSVGWTALVYAARHGNVTVVDRLLKAGAHTNPGEPLVIHAVRGGSLDLVKYLVEQNQQLVKLHDDTNRNTPLHVACMHGSHEIIASLMQNLADVDAMNNDGETPWELSVLGSYPPPPALLNLMSEKSELMDMIQVRDPNFLSKLILKQVETDRDEEDESRLDCLRCLHFRYHFDLNALNDKQKTPVCEAAFFGLKKMTRLLITLGADQWAFSPGIHDMSALEACIFNMHSECLKSMLEVTDPQTATRVGSEDRSLLHTLACSVEDEDTKDSAKFEPMARLLIDFGVSINEQDIDGKTALHHASAYGRLSLCTFLLLDAHADATILDHMGRTADKLTDNQEIKNLFVMMGAIAPPHQQVSSSSSIQQPNSQDWQTLGNAAGLYNLYQATEQGSVDAYPDARDWMDMS